MNTSFVIINSLDDVDFDGVYNGSLDSIEKNWPTNSPIQREEIKTHIRNMIQSSLNGDWPGLTPHAETDTHVLFKHVDLDTNTDMGLVSAYITADGILDGKHSFSRAEANGSRNYIYTAQHVEARNQFYRDNGISKIRYNNLPEDSHLYKFLKYKAGGNYDIVEDIETPGMVGYRTLVTAPRL